MNIQPIDLLERDYCVSAIEMMTNVSVDTYISVCKQKTCHNASKEDQLAISKFTIINDRIHRFLCRIIIITPTSIDEFNCRELTMRRIENTVIVTQNMSNRRDLFYNVNIDASSYLMRLNTYRQWALSPTHVSIEKCENFTEKKNAERKNCMTSKTPADLLALHEKDPKVWSLRTLGDHYYPYDPNNASETKRNWAWRTLRKARKQRISK